MMPKFSIIIVNYNSGPFLAELIESFISLHLPPDDFEFIVVDNASVDGSLSKVNWRGLDKTIILNTQNNGFAKANNQGIKISRGKYIVLLNPDTRVINNIFTLMENVMVSDRSIGICGPRIYYPDGRDQLSCFSFPSVVRQISVMVGFTDFLTKNKILRNVLDKSKRFLPKSARVFSTNFNSVDTPIEVPWVSGACMMLKREVMDTIGLLDENFFAYAEDEDFCLRAGHAGYRIYYVANAKLVHHLGWKRTSKKSKESVDIYFRSLKYFYEKHYKGLKRTVLILLNKIDWVNNVRRTA